MASVRVHIAVLSIAGDAASGNVAMESIVADRATEAGHQISAFSAVRDSEVAIRAELVGWIEDPEIDVVIVVGEGEATSRALAPLVTQPLPGFGDLLRMLAFQEIGASAMLSTAEAARCDSTFVFVLPATENAVRAAMEKLIIPQLDPQTKPRNLIAAMPRLSDVTKVDRATTDVDATNGEPASADVTKTDLTRTENVPTEIEAEKTAAGFGPALRLPAPPAQRAKSRTGANVIARKVEDPTKPIDLVKLERQLEMSKTSEVTKRVDVSKIGDTTKPLDLGRLQRDADAATVVRPVPTNVIGTRKHPTQPAPTSAPPVTPLAPAMSPAASRPSAASAPSPSAPAASRSGPSASPTPARRVEPSAAPLRSVLPARPGQTGSSPRPTASSSNPVSPAAAARPAVNSPAQSPPAARAAPPAPVADVADEPIELRPRAPAAERADEPIEIRSRAPARDADEPIELRPRARPAELPAPKLAREEPARVTVEAEPLVIESAAAPEPAAMPDPVEAPTQRRPPPPPPAADAAAPEPVEAERRPPPPPPARSPAPEPPPAPPPAPEPAPPPPLRELPAPPAASVSAELPHGAFVYPTVQRRSKAPILFALLLLVALGAGGFVFLKYRDNGTPDGPRPSQVAQVAPAAARDAVETAPTETADATVAAVADAAVADAVEAEIEVEVPDAQVAQPPVVVAKKPTTRRSPKPRVAVNPGSSTAKPEPRPAVTPEPRPTVKADAPVESGCDEVACVLEKYARPCCARFKPADSGVQAVAPGETLDRTQIRAGIDRVRPKVIGCGEQFKVKGTVKLAISVDGEGNISELAVQISPDDALGNCVADAVRKARFAKTANGGSFTYPFVF